MCFVISYVDINECREGDDMCAQTCTNTAGGHVCSCHPGYILHADTYSCTGKT